MSLTKHQQKRYTKLIEFIDNDDKHNIILTGSAGCGKSFISCKIIKEVLNRDLTACVIAPTNKALFEIKDKYKDEDIEFMTIAQFLYKIKRYSKTGELMFKIGKDKKHLSREYDYIFIDECSMIEDDDYNCFEELIKTNNSKIIYIGDSCQLPPINNKSSVVFEDVCDKVELCKVIRANNNDIKKVNKQFRGVFKGKLINMDPKWYIQDNCNVFCTENRTGFINSIKKNMDGDGKIIAYTNKNVQYYNKLSRELLFGKNIDKYVKGEKIVFNNHYINNDGIKYYSNQEVTIENVKIIRKVHSNSKLYKVYELKLSDGVLYRVHPDDEKNYILYFSDMYKQLKADKATDKEWEKHYDEKYEFLPPIDYCYSLTVHRSQGSTYKNVFVDMNDISGVAANHKDVDLERVLYTAISRASDKLFCYY